MEPKYRVPARARSGLERVRRIFSPNATSPHRRARGVGIFARPVRRGPPSNSCHPVLPGRKRMDAALNAELEHIWSRVQAELALSVDEPTYRIWLQPLRARELTGGRLLIEAPPQACGWIHDRFGRLLQTSVATVLGPDALVDLVAGTAPGARSRGVVHPPAAALTGAPPGAWRARPGDSLVPRGAGHPPEFPAAPDRVLAPDAGCGAGPGGNPKLTFDQFVIGDSNRLAHAAALT